MWNSHRLRSLLAIIATLPAFVSIAPAQTFTGSSTGGVTQARPAGREAIRTADARATPTAATAPSNKSSRSAGPLVPIGVAQGQPTLGSVKPGNGVLPNEAGQIWREYDLTPYTSQLKEVEKPEQAVIDWILRDTGTELWFSAPLGILSADRNTLRVYHTPPVQETVKAIYDRFLSTSAAKNRLGVKIVTVNSPNWRARALPLLKPVEVKSPGVEAWLLPRENAVLLMNELKQRADAKEQNSAVLEIANGQTKPTGLTRPRTYLRTVRARSDGFAAYEPVTGTIEEGYSLELSPLASADGQTLDLVVKCEIDQVERLLDIPVDLPTPVGTAQRITLQVPQLVSWRLHERFRWPADHVLLLSCGVVAAPGNEARTLPLLGGLMGNPRADALLFVEPLLATTPLSPLPIPPGLLAGTNSSVSPLPLPLPNTSATSFSSGNLGTGANPANPFIATPLMPGRNNEPWRR